MSKSLGNSEDAADAVNRIGADVLRLVYASLDYTTEIALGATVYTAVSEASVGPGILDSVVSAHSSVPVRIPSTIP